jgi:hypothetical protein
MKKTILCALCVGISSVFLTTLILMIFFSRKNGKDQFEEKIKEMYKTAEWENYPDLELSVSENSECVAVIMDYYLEIHSATFCENDDDCTHLKLHGCPISINKNSIEKIKSSYSGSIMRNKCMPEEYFSLQASCVDTKSQCNKEKNRCYNKVLTDEELREIYKL